MNNRIQKLTMSKRAFLLGAALVSAMGVNSVSAQTAQSLSRVKIEGSEIVKDSIIDFNAYPA